VKLGELPLEKALIIIESQAKSFKKFTDSNGNITFVNIPNEIYYITVKMQNGTAYYYPIIFNNGFFCIREDAVYDEYNGDLNRFIIKSGKLTVIASN
jgi:hypothetical protein